MGMVTLSLSLQAIESCAVPICAFLLVEGCQHTSSIKNYLIRVTVLALVSEVLYNVVKSGFFIDISFCNPVWCVVLDLVLLGLFRYVDQKRKDNSLLKIVMGISGLLALPPEDSGFKPNCDDTRKNRDLALHQGAVWSFHLSAYHLAYLNFSAAARETVAMQLEPLEASLREDCIGQIPEICEDLTSGASQGCFAQARSVGEILRDCEALEKGTF